MDSVLYLLHRGAEIHHSFAMPRKNEQNALKTLYYKLKLGNCIKTFGGLRSEKLFTLALSVLLKLLEMGVKLITEIIISITFIKC
jgi:hypothetical protein